LIRPFGQCSQASHLIFVVFHRICGRDGHRAEDIEVLAHEVVDAEEGGNGAGFLDFHVQLAIQKVVTQAVACGESRFRNPVEPAKELLE
jgi:hypothetical protein